MEFNYFEVIRPGIYSTFQDIGFKNTQHLGITTSGVIDPSLFYIANSLLNNDLNLPMLEFAFQGPKLKLLKGKSKFSITGDVEFKIIKKNEIINGISNRSYCLNKGDIVDIIRTINSNYGYLAVEGGFAIKENFHSFSTLTYSSVGPNQGKKILRNQRINFYKNGNRINKELKNGLIKKISKVRVLQGPQMNFFMLKTINKFFESNYIVNKLSNRIGIRIKGSKIFAIKSHNIDSEPVVKGSVQIPGSGEPIVLMNDHPTIGGYPKIATVILDDLPLLAQLPIGGNFQFELISLKDAEQIFKESWVKLKKQLLEIRTI